MAIIDKTRPLFPLEEVYLDNDTTIPNHNSNSDVKHIELIVLIRVLWGLVKENTTRKGGDGMLFTLILC